MTLFLSYRSMTVTARIHVHLAHRGADFPSGTLDLCALGSSVITVYLWLLLSQETQLL